MQGVLMSWSPLERKIFMEIMERIAIKVSAIVCAMDGLRAPHRG